MSDARKEILATIDLMYNTGMKPTIPKILEIRGKGSYQTIREVFNLWKEENKPKLENEKIRQRLFACMALLGSSGSSDKKINLRINKIIFNIKECIKKL